MMCDRISFGSFVVALAAGAVALAAGAALAGCATGASLSSGKPLQLPASARSLTIHATAETSIEQPYLVLIEQRLEQRLGALGRFDAISGTIGRTPMPAGLRLDVRVTDKGGMRGYSIHTTLVGEVVDAKDGSVLGHFESTGRANNSSKAGATVDAALDLAIDQIVSYVAAGQSEGSAAAGPPRTGFLGKWAGTRSLNGERGVVAINETFEFAADGTFFMTAEKKYTSDRAFATDARGCVKTWTLRGTWVAAKSQVGFVPTEAQEGWQSCVDPRVDRPLARSGSTNLGPFTYSNVGSALILKSSGDLHSLQPR